MTQTVNKKLLEEMLASACHFGHKVSRWNPKMRSYIYTKRDGIHIFDLTKTYECLVRAMDFIQKNVSEGKTVLLVSTKLQAARLISEAAKKCGVPYVTRKWMPGLLTNFDTIRKRIKYFKDLRDSRATGGWEKYTKKERLELSRTLEKLEDAFSGVETMTHLPSAVFVLDAVRDTLALREASRLRIPTIAICDTNSDPDLVTYPIPGNDDAVASLRFFVDRIAGAIEAGKKDQKTPLPDNKTAPTDAKTAPADVKTAPVDNK